MTENWRTCKAKWFHSFKLNSGGVLHGNSQSHEKEVSQKSAKIHGHTGDAVFNVSVCSALYHKLTLRRNLKTFFKFSV